MQSMAALAIGSFFFFFNDTAPTEIYTLSLHDALPISFNFSICFAAPFEGFFLPMRSLRSEEHTSELQSRFDLVCRLLLEKKKSRSMPRLLGDTTAPAPGRALPRCQRLAVFLPRRCPGV